MKCFVLGLILCAAAVAEDTNPIYKITVVQRSLAAINYGHRTLPTKIDFRGTVLYPEANGKATVQAKSGVVEIDAKFAKLGTASKFGPQYLTYVLWAISPQGQFERLGEIVTNHADKSSLRVTSSMQIFGLMVTAEPYYAVSRPSSIVVLENFLRPETVGQVEQVQAKYELLPSQDYVYDIDKARVAAQQPGAPMVSQKEYESMLALYQAQNAIQNAKAEGADEHASETYQKAVSQLAQAQQMGDRKNNSQQIVTLARQATQTAEDARQIAKKRQQDLRDGNVSLRQ
jgi:hypothetical protein